MGRDLAFGQGSGRICPAAADGMARCQDNSRFRHFLLSSWRSIRNLRETLRAVSDTAVALGSNNWYRFFASAGVPDSMQSVRKEELRIDTVDLGSTDLDQVDAA